MGNMIELISHDSIIEVGLNRPDAFNAFNLEMMTDMAEQMNKIASDEKIRGVVITGRGKAFCAGGDLAWIADYSEDYSASFHRLAAQFHAMILEIRRMKKPVVAAINGAAAGGGFSIALACDFRIMEESAVMKQAYTSSGLCLDGGGSYTLPKLVGLAKALEIAAFDEVINADKALEWGLITQKVAKGEALHTALDILKELVQKSTNAFGVVKNLINDSYNQSFESILENERASLAACGKHKDGVEGISAFLEKRKPKFI